VRLTVGDVLTATGGRLVVGDRHATVDGASTDSRTLRAGQLWVAISATRDGHDFAPAAVAAGAGALVVAEAALGRPAVAEVVAAAAAPVVAVAAPADALTALGGAARSRFGSRPVIGVTGSTGKTSTKDLLVGALGTTLRVAAAEASFNNEIGVPLTLLGAADDAEVLVLELGMRGLGQIAALCAVARPTVGIVTNVGLAHAETLGGPEGVARAKGELPEALPPDGTAVLPADDGQLGTLVGRTRARVVTFGEAARADVRVERLRVDGRLVPMFDLATPAGRVGIRLAVHGGHQARNAAAAAAAALAVGCPLDRVAEGLEAARVSRWRSELRETPGGVVVLHDAYNANPDSVAAALRSLGALAIPGRRIAVLGRMAELGAHTETEHRRMGELAAALGIDVVVGVGTQVGELLQAARRGGAETRSTASPAEAAALLAGMVTAGDAVLVKASRVVGLEVVVDALGATSPAGPAPVPFDGSGPDQERPR
jgi:UDP-N-acetylmuramoyl-tripeptide--D-alanyl-D-alanine ligase